MTSESEPTPMLPPLYKTPEVLTAERHQALSLLSSADYGFARSINSVILGAIELPSAMHHYPIVFTTTGHPAAVAVLGVESGKNLFVTDDGLWQSDTYIPAYIRRYPFVFLEQPASGELTLCIDADCNRLVTSGEAPLFVEGQPSELTLNALALCQDYHGQLQLSESLVTALAEHNLLVPNQARLTTPDGRSFTLQGFQVLDERKFNELPDDILLEWRRRGWLNLLYAHLFSSGRWTALLRKL